MIREQVSRALKVSTPSKPEITKSPTDNRCSDFKNLFSVSTLFGAAEKLLHSTKLGIRYIKKCCPLILKDVNKFVVFGWPTPDFQDWEKHD